VGDRDKTRRRSFNNNKSSGVIRLRGIRKMGRGRAAIIVRGRGENKNIRRDSRAYALLYVHTARAREILRERFHTFVDFSKFFSRASPISISSTIISLIGKRRPAFTP